MAKKFDLTNAKLVSMPIEVKAQFSVEKCPSMLKLNQWRGYLTVKLLVVFFWPEVVLRPDITFTIGTLSHFIQNPGNAHWEAIKQVIVYLGCMKNYWLTFGVKSKPKSKGFATHIGQARNTITQYWNTLTFITILYKKLLRTTKSPSVTSNR